MIKKLALATAVFTASSTAQATTLSPEITVTTFSFSEWTSRLGTGAVVEDFEKRSTLSGTFENGADVASGATMEGELKAGTVLDTPVGSFGTLGPQGSGTTCGALSLGNGVCDNIALQQDPGQNGQSNILPVNGI